MNTAVNSEPELILSTIARAPVTSSNIRSIGYDEVSRTLAVEFNTGRVYHYDGIEPELHQSLVQAESIGSFFGKNIRGRFKTTAMKQEAQAEAAQGTS